MAIFDCFTFFNEFDVLESIDTEQQSFRNDAKVKQCVKEISSLIWDYKKMLE